jgi:hypothetical protein
VIARNESAELIDAVDEAPLPIIGRAATEAAMCVEDRQQGQADAVRLRRGDDALGQLAEIVVRRARGIVMDIVKLTDHRKTRLQHFDIGLCGDRFDILRRHAADKAVHQLTPGPEAVE